LKDIAQAKDVGLGADATLRQIVDTIDANRKGVVVLLREGRPVGILTERDVVELLSGGGTLDDPVDPRFSKRALVTAKGDRTIAFALSITLDNNVRPLIVTDTANRFLGVVTQQDLLKYLEEDFYRPTICVKHIIGSLTRLVSTSPRGTLTSVLQQMVDHKIGAVVITKNDKAVGIITEKDILKLARSDVPLTDTVEAHMTSPVVCADANVPLEHIVELMKERNIRRVVIVDNEELATNVVTVRDVVGNLEGSYSKFLERKLRNAKDILNLLPDMLLEVEDTEGGHVIRWANATIIDRFGKEVLDKPV
jgi:CBS domain-containing protein